MTEAEVYDNFVKELQEKYPEMYENVYCGISIDAGWYDIVRALSGNIYHHYKWKIKNNPDLEFPKVAQIKEKFGGLRFYVDGGDEATHGMIRMAEAWADRTCEVCGAPGHSREGGWIKTLCDTHDAERKARYKKDFDE